MAEGEGDTVRGGGRGNAFPWVGDWPRDLLRVSSKEHALMIFLQWVSNKDGFMVSVLHKLLTVSCMENLRSGKAKTFAG